MFVVSALRRAIISQLSPQLRQFLQSRITSVHQLEELLLLQRYNERRWRANEVGRELYTHVMSAEDEMKRLRHMGFVKSEGQPPDELFWYEPSDEQVKRLLEGLAEAYRNYRVRVIDAIFAPSQDALKQFSDAFSLKPREPQE